MTKDREAPKDCGMAYLRKFASRLNLVLQQNDPPAMVVGNEINLIEKAALVAFGKEAAGTLNRQRWERAMEDFGFCHICEEGLPRDGSGCQFCQDKGDDMARKAGIDLN